MSSVSVIMSTYARNKPSKNCPNQLRRAIESVLSQTFWDLELILIDDGSKDGTEAICKEYALKDSRVRVTRFEQNSGLPAIRYNQGMKMATSNYYMFMFDDDMWLPNAVDDLYGAITGKYKDFGMVYGVIEWETPRGTIATLGEEWNIRRLQVDNLLANVAVIIKREVINAVGGYEQHPSFKRLCDWDLWQRVGKKFLVARVPKLIGKVFLQPDGIGATVPLDREGMKKVQDSPDRTVTLQGELPGSISVNAVKTSKKADNNSKNMVFVYNGHDAALVRWALTYLSEALRKQGVTVSVVNIATTEDEYWAEEADVVMVFRSFDLKILHMMRRMKAQGKFVMFFLDDYLFQPDCKYTGTWKMPMEHLYEADCLVSSSAKLLSKMPEKPKILRRSVLDAESIGILSREYRTDNSRFDIGWLCSSGRANTMDRFVYKMLQALDVNIPDGIKCTFHYFGRRAFTPFPKVITKEHLYVQPADWRSLYQIWGDMGLCALINPLEEADEFCQCKSELKFVEAAAMNVPLITSRVKPYTEFLKEGETGFFASTPKECAEKLLLLMNNEALSRTVSANSKAYLLEHYDVQKNAKQFLADVEAAMNKNLRILVQKNREWSEWAAIIQKKPF